MSQYLIIGGGPDAQNWRGYNTPHDKIITSNRGLAWCDNPDAYWITDPLAIERYHHLWSNYIGEIITNADLGRPTTRWPYLNGGPVYHGRSSGICACRVALARGATHLHLVGFNGHNPGDTVKDVNDKPWFAYGAQAKLRNEAMAASFRDMAVGNPQVNFVLYGPSVISLPADLPNWSNHA